MELFVTNQLLLRAAEDLGVPERALERYRSRNVPDCMPFLLDHRGGYVRLLNSFLRDLPAWGCNSQNTWSAYANDLLGLMRHLESRNPPRDLLDAGFSDLKDYRDACRNGMNPALDATSWNRAVAAFEKFFGWARANALVAKPPFHYRNGRNWRGQTVKANTLYERVGGDDRIKCVSLEDYRIFRDVGLRGMLPDRRTEDPEFDRRNGFRNALMADMMLNTGMRVAEFVSLLDVEMPTLRATDVKLPGAGWKPGASPIFVASYTAKGRRGRRVQVGNRLVSEAVRYKLYERDAAVGRGLDSHAYEDPFDWVRMRHAGNGKAKLLDGNGAGRVGYAVMNTELRRRLVIVDEAGRPVEPASFWLGEDGRPMSDDNVRMIFTRASQRCASLLEREFKVTPHTLRHTFAVHMLSLLVRQSLDVANDLSLLRGRRQSMGEQAFFEYAMNPLRRLMQLLGHRSVTSTQVYLTHMVESPRFDAGATMAFDAELLDAPAIADTVSWKGSRS